MKAFAEEKFEGVTFTAIESETEAESESKTCIVELSLYPFFSAPEGRLDFV